MAGGGWTIPENVGGGAETSIIAEGEMKEGIDKSLTVEMELVIVVVDWVEHKLDTAVVVVVEHAAEVEFIGLVDIAIKE